MDGHAEQGGGSGELAEHNLDRNHGGWAERADGLAERVGFAERERSVAAALDG